LRRLSRGLPLVEVQETAETFAALRSTDFPLLAARLLDESAAKALVIPFQTD
jgi:hypothetical protein